MTWIYFGNSNLSKTLLKKNTHLWFASCLPKFQTCFFLFKVDTGNRNWFFMHMRCSFLIYIRFWQKQTRARWFKSKLRHELETADYFLGVVFHVLYQIYFFYCKHWAWQWHEAYWNRYLIIVISLSTLGSMIDWSTCVILDWVLVWAVSDSKKP